MVRDLRDVYLRASSVLTDWEMIGQAAQAIVARRAARAGDAVPGGDEASGHVGQRQDQGVLDPGAGLMTCRRAAASDADVSVVVRPLGNPLPLGFLALMVATTAVAMLQLGVLEPARAEWSRPASSR